MPEIPAKSKSLTVQATWILFAKIFSYALGVAVPLLLARRLDQTEFGLYKQIFLIIATANALLSFNFGMSAYYYLPRETDLRRRGAIMLNILLFNGVVGSLAGLMLFLQPNVLTLIFRDEEMTQFAPSLGLVLAFWIFSSLLETLAVANQEPKLAMTFIIAANLSKAIFFIVAAALFGTVQSLVWAALAQAFLQSAILLWYARSRFPGFWRNWSFGLFREQFFYALPFGLLGCLYTLQTDLHSYFVSHRYAPAEFAIYAVGCFDLPLIGMLSEAAAAVLIPLMSRLQSADDRREIIETSARVMRKLAVAYFPIYAFLMITAETFITTLFTDKFAASVPIFRLNLTLLPFLIVTLDPIVRSYKKLGYFVLRVRIGLFAVMIFALWRATNYGDLLTVNAVVVTFVLLERFVTTLKVMRTIGWRKADWQLLDGVLKVALASLLAASATLIFYFLTNESLRPLLRDWVAEILSNVAAPKLAGLFSGAIFLGICAAVFAPIYLLLIYLSGAIDRDEKRKIWNVWQRIRFRNNIVDKSESAVSIEI